MIRYIANNGDYFPSNYFGEDFHKNVLDKSGFTREQIGELNKKVRALRKNYFDFKDTYVRVRAKTDLDRIELTHHFHTQVLKMLGYDGEDNEYNDLFLLDDQKKYIIPVRHKLYRGEQPHLFVLEMKAMIKRDANHEPQGLFEQRYHESQWKNLFSITDDGYKLSPSIINRAVSELFQLRENQSPKYILLLAGNTIFLMEKDRWFEGAYLEFNLEVLFEDASISKQRDFLALFYLLLAKETLAPDADTVLLETLGEEAYKAAAAVTQDLKKGVIKAVEAIANEAIWYLINHENSEVKGFENLLDLSDSFEKDLRDDCLTIIYRLLFLFYAESRPTLQILPVNDDTYLKGYSLEMLRDLEQIPLLNDQTRNGYFFQESFTRLFQLLENGAKPENTFIIRAIDSPIFNQNQLKLLANVQLRNFVWQDIIQQFSLTEVGNKHGRKRISYANLGVNQLGSVYENLLSYRGFFAETDLIEVHKKNKPQEGTFLVAHSRLDDFHPDEVKRNPETDAEIIIPSGQFLYRLSGRDRQKSASYYTPDVLTKTTVQYTLKPILEREDLRADDLLELKLLEPAMGAGAFLSEVIDQLAEAYLSRKQAERKERINPNDYLNEKQKVKAYLATNNLYGVDLNPTAVEFGKLALWLNVIHQEMEVPFFGYRIGTGNAVVGAWLKVYNKKDFLFDPKKKNKKWWEKAPKMLEWQDLRLKAEENKNANASIPNS